MFEYFFGQVWKEKCLCFYSMKTKTTENDPTTDRAASAFPSQQHLNTAATTTGQDYMALQGPLGPDGSQRGLPEDTPEEYLYPVDQAESSFGGESNISRASSISVSIYAEPYQHHSTRENQPHYEEIV